MLQFALSFFPFQLSFQIERKHRYRRHFDIDDWLFSLHLLFWYRTETARTFGVESVSVSYRHPNRNVRGFLVCVSIMKREGNMASMPFLFDTWSGSLQWHRMIFFFLFYVVYFSFFIFVFFIAHRESEKRQKKKLLLDYLYSNLKNHNFWAYRYFFCEFLGLVNIFGTYPSAQILNVHCGTSTDLVDSARGSI